MRDEEHIELAQKEQSVTKPIYKLRALDFIPIVGYVNHYGRCLNKVK